MSSKPKTNIKWVCSMGDSITNPITSSILVPKDQMYPYYLQTSLSKPYRVRNFGNPGDTTTQMLSRFSAMTSKYVPTIAIIYGGINDYVNSISDSTTTSNLQSMISQLQNAGCNKIVLCNIHTITSGNDSLYSAKRTVIQNVATTSGSNVVFCDLHAVSLVAGDYIDDKHLYGTGLQKLANAIYNTIVTQGWNK